jgi:hypothetical protein
MVSLFLVKLDAELDAIYCLKLYAEPLWLSLLTNYPACIYSKSPFCDLLAALLAVIFQLLLLESFDRFVQTFF